MNQSSQSSQSRQLDIRPLTPVLGAEVFGIDLSQQLSAAQVAAVRRALIEHQVALVLVRRSRDCAR